MKILITAPYFRPVPIKYSDMLNQHHIEYDTFEVEEKCFESDLIPIIHKYDGVIAGDDQYTSAVFEKASKLKVIAKWGTGIDSIDLNAAKKHGVQVLNTADAFVKPVSQTVFGYILSFARNIHTQNTLMKNGKWGKVESVSLSESSLGVIGLGSIGKEVLRLGKAFRMDLYGYDINETSKAFIEETSTQLVSKETVLKKSDFVSLHCVLNESTKHIISTEELNMMKSNAVLINTARGPLINESDLIKAINSKTIFGAGLDVFEKEPLDPRSPLRSMDNVLLTPHNSNSSPKVREYVHENTMKNLLTGLEII
ncbi:phosphoglycerate dehydrogenase [Caldithrix abyssi]|nr:phosphoglycerate dehydrogenase [Caldithrix abyssi]